MRPVFAVNFVKLDSKAPEDLQVTGTKTLKNFQSRCG